MQNYLRESIYVVSQIFCISILWNIHPSLADTAPLEQVPTKQTGQAGSAAKLMRSAVALNASALKKIDQSALEALVAQNAKTMLIPGAVVLLRTPQGEFDVVNGTTQIGKQSPPSTKTNFRIASNTKTMTAAIICQLDDEGKLNLKDPISKYVAGVPNGDKISIENLLKMRSGLYGYTDAPELSQSIDRNPKKIWTAKEVLAIAFNHPVQGAPDTKYEYSNTNYALLGLVIEKVDRKPLADSMHQRLFRPLEMKNTFLPKPASNVIPEPLSHGYLYGSSSAALIGTPYTEKLKSDARTGKLQPTDYTNVNHSFAAAAGGVISTAEDLAIWIEALNTGRLFTPKCRQKWNDSLQLEDPSEPQGMKYGFGITQMHWGPNSYLFHGGETAGFNSFIGYDATNHVTLIVWTNLTLSLDELPTANSLMLKVLDHIYQVSPIPKTSDNNASSAQ